MSDFKTRMKEEYDELLGRIDALDAFIVANESREGSDVSDEHYRTMQTQLHAMCAYEGALRMRIEDLGIALDVGELRGEGTDE